MPDVSVAIPTLDGGERFAGVLRALSSQTLAHELVVLDSGSRDGTVELARAHGARVSEIERSSFTHGGARNLLMGMASGAHVAFLTQDAEPASELWLERLLGGFELGGDVALVYGPYSPRPDASLAVRLELTAWFLSLSPEGTPQVERLAEAERSLAAAELVGRRGFFTDANGCVARAAWELIPYREATIAEDRALAMDMLRAGYAKAYVPSAAVVHSHDYAPLGQLRRSFDEWRGLREVYGWREPGSPRRLAREVRAALRRARADGRQSPGALAGVVRHELLRAAGAQLGSRADRLPPAARRALSLERRDGYSPMRRPEA